MDISEVQDLYDREAVVMTQHFLDKAGERDIKLSDIKTAISNGEIIEHYPDDFPYPSALILGLSESKTLHIVAGIGDDFLWLITAYYPDLDKWESDYRTRKEEM